MRRLRKQINGKEQTIVLDLTSAINGFKLEREQAEKRLKEKQAEVNKLLKDSQDVESDNQKIVKENENLRLNNKKFIQEKTDKEQEIKEIEQKIRELNSQVENKVEEINGLRAEYDKTISGQNEKVSKLNADFEALTKRMSAEILNLDQTIKAKQIDKETLEKTMEENKIKYNESITSLLYAENEAEIKKRELETINNLIMAAKDNLLNINSEIAKRETIIENSELSIKEKANTLSEKEQKIKSIDEREVTLGIKALNLEVQSKKIEQLYQKAGLTSNL